MAFILEQSPTFTHPLVIREVQDGGRLRTHQFTAVFRRLPQSRMEEVQLQYQAIKVAAQRGEPIEGIPTRGIADELLDGWEGITTPDGQPVEVTTEAKAKLLEVPGMADVIVTTFFEAHDKARSKN
ncbi:MAG: hypothetical protein ACO3GP_02885 [Candidatus Limnocylindrus sp.]